MPIEFWLQKLIKNLMGKNEANFKITMIIFKNSQNIGTITLDITVHAHFLFLHLDHICHHIMLI